MKSNKGFTLTEVLLAVMIVGLVGVALAALTGTAVRESNVGRTRMMIRNQASIALRQLRQDVYQASKGVSGCNGGGWSFTQSDAIGPENSPTGVAYAYNNNVITRNGDPWLNNVKNSSHEIPVCEFVDSGAGNSSIMKIRLMLGVDSEPPVTEYIEEIFMVPHGIAIKVEE